MARKGVTANLGSQLVHWFDRRSASAEQADTAFFSRIDPDDELVANAYAWSRALNAATVLEVDDVIDPADTRKWLAMGLASVPQPPPRS